MYKRQNETYQKKYGYSPITREMLDEFSYNSQVKADGAVAVLLLEGLVGADILSGCLLYTSRCV